MKKSNYTYIVLSLILLFAGCRKNEITVTTEDEVLPETENVSFQFLVTNESGDPIDNASVQINSQIYYSDENGVVITDAQNIASLGTKSQILAEGYEPLVKLLNGSENSVRQERIILFKAESHVISTGSSATIDGGGKLTLPSSLINEDGSVYSGEVTVKNKYLNPDNKDFLRSAPGDLLALNNAGAYNQLASFGMYMIELFDTEGAELKIPEGNTATIEFPIADVNLNDVPSQVPLWYFDDDTGLWMEDGVAYVQGDVMVAEVSHFTWWNCDLPYDFVEVCLLFWDDEGNPIPWLEVEFNVNGAQFGLATTDANGIIIAKIPVGLSIDLKYYINDSEIGTQIIGPYAQSTRKEIITTDLNPKKIFGVAVDCGSNPVSNGYGYYETALGLNMVTIATDGSFIYYAPGVEHQLDLVDINFGKLKRIEISVEEQNEDLDLGTVIVCEDEISTKISGHVLIDTDEDNEGDTPWSMAQITIENVTDGEFSELFTGQNGYYEFAALPGKLYKLRHSYIEPYTIVAAGDRSQDDDNQNDEFKFGRNFIFVISLQDEHDSDNDFWVIPSGEGVISGTAMADTDNDGIADSPLEWMTVTFDKRPGGNKEVLVGSDGSFSDSSEAGAYILFDLNFLQYSTLVDWDTTPDPDGGNDGSGADFFIDVVLQDGEIDADNTFVMDHSFERTLIIRVMEDTNNDGIGDSPLEDVRIKRQNNNGGISLSGVKTDAFGLVSFALGDNNGNLYTITVESPEYDVINIIDTSPDNDPFIVDGDVTKMEIDVSEGEWDAGNIFVVRKN